MVCWPTMYKCTGLIHDAPYPNLRCWGTGRTICQGLIIDWQSSEEYLTFPHICDKIGT
jgi:hypothetical protein